MAQARQRRSGGTRRTLVRGSDGALYLLTKTDRPVKLTEDEARKVTEILEGTQEKLARIVKEELSQIVQGCEQFVDITIPDVSME